MKPVTIKYHKTITDPAVSKRHILESIKELLESKKLQIVHISENEIIYEGTTRRFVSNWDISRGVDKGIFYLNETVSGIVLEYHIQINSLIYFAITVGVLIGLVASAGTPDILVFILLPALNLAITYSRHEDFFHELLERLILTRDEVCRAEEFKAGSVRVKKDAGKITLITLLFLLAIILVIVLLPF
ncbi:hypothetical protein [Desertivirga brevis]|uniref:hypothetical protein n=1 Tax=Desertivirga brevis TaxID=2810310 RepID=UPI001A96AC9E|nr:hypothetical protein [Pedobacter sp. SYSU D00873]